MIVGFSTLLPPKSMCQGQELNQRNIKQHPQAALLGWILSQTRITPCLFMLLEVSFYVFELLFLGTHSYGQSGSSKCSEISRSSPWAAVLHSGCWARLVSGWWEGEMFPCPVGRVIPREESQSECPAARVGAHDPSFPTSPSIKCEGPYSGIRDKISGSGALREHQGSTECYSIGTRAAGGREGIQAAQQW